MSIEFIRKLFLNDAGNVDWLMIAAGAVALVYGIMLLLLPFAVWKIRSETVRARRAAQATQSYAKECRDVLRALLDQNAESAASIRRISRSSSDAPAAIKKIETKEVEHG